MKRLAILISAALVLSSCGVSYNKTKHFDDEHFTELQKIMDNKPTPKNAKYVYTEASELNLIGKILDNTPNPYHRVDTVKYKGFTKGENLQVRCSAGLAVLFKTNSSSITIKTLWGDKHTEYYSIPLTLAGYDLYIRNEKGEWEWAKNAFGDPDKDGKVVVTPNRGGASGFVRVRIRPDGEDVK